MALHLKILGKWVVAGFANMKNWIMVATLRKTTVENTDYLAITPQRPVTIEQWGIDRFTVRIEELEVFSLGSLSSSVRTKTRRELYSCSFSSVEFVEQLVV